MTPATKRRRIASSPEPESFVQDEIITKSKGKQLFDLGFVFVAANEKALEESGGDIEAAVEWLLTNSDKVVEQQIQADLDFNLALQLSFELDYSPDLAIHKYPLTVSWLLSHQRLQHPDSITPKDSLDTLGIPAAFYPQGRAPSKSLLVGKHPVSKSMDPQQLKLWSSPRTRPKIPSQKATTLFPSGFIVIPPISKVSIGLDDGNIGNSYGNIALSSCPGEKGRDLELDFKHLASLDIRVVVCCLRDSTMKDLRVPFADYQAATNKYGIKVLRVPMRSGDGPKTMKEVSEVVESMDHVLRAGGNVLVHCKAGIGRAGLVASCFLLRKQFVVSAERAIQFVRIRRSLSAIETTRQEEFIHAYKTQECK
ncbi:UNVERIFIED_CONTAM: hypothetical protein HDU68_010078 [Siphonaria sp. JEL0065]|nr:hypothetical protein HDU68_010078 [Siphonaria sp. JEL0065]